MREGWKIIVNPKFESFRKSIESIPFYVKDKGEIIYSDRNTIYRLDIGGVDATVKEFHIPAPFNRFVYSYLRHSKARRSFDNAIELERLGIGTPEPIAYIEEYSSGLLARSYYICRMVEGQNIRHWETEVVNYKEMIDAFAAFTLDLHNKGVLHKDYSPGNILFNLNENGNYHFYLIDINRMKFNVFDKKKLYRNFRCLNIDTEVETARVAIDYARHAGLDQEAMGNLAVKMLRKYHSEKKRHRMMKMLFKKKKQKH